MRSLLAAIAIALSCVGALVCEGCGSSQAHDPATVSVAGNGLSDSFSGQAHVGAVRDSDGDGDGSGRYDSDDRAIVHSGRPASSAEIRAITPVLRRYFAVATAGDGATACSLMFSLFSESVAEDYGEAAGPLSLRAKTCAAVMSKLFAQRHAQLIVDDATLKVRGARVSGVRAFVLLSFRGEPDRYISVHRESGAWKVDGLLDFPIP